MRQYRLIISKGQQGQEILLNQDMQNFKFGNTKECSVKLGEDGDCEINVRRKADSWQIISWDPYYICVNNNREAAVLSQNLTHGIRLTIVNRGMKEPIYEIYYEINFDLVHQNYNQVINLMNFSSVRIGAGDACEIKLGDPDAMGEFVILLRQGDGWVMEPQNTRYGVYVNSRKIVGKRKIPLHYGDFFYLMDYIFYYKNDCLYTSDSSMLKVNGLITRMNVDSNSLFEYPQYNRNTRMKPMLEEEDIDILEAPEYPKPPANNLLMSIIPALCTLMLTVVLRGIMGSGGTFVIFSASMNILGIGTSIANYVSGKKQYRRKVEEREAAYTAYLQNKQREMNLTQKEEIEILERLYYPLEKEKAFVEQFTGDIFDRQITDEDFLHVRLGTGKIAAHRKIAYKKPERLQIDDELTLMPERMAMQYKYIQPAPVICDFRTANMIGILGPDHLLMQMMGNIVMDIVVRHYYQDVKLFFISGKEYVDTVRELRFLPHLRNEDLGIRNIAYDDDSKNTLFEYLYKLLSVRSGEEITLPWVVVFVLDDMDIKKHPLAKYMKTASQIGATFVFMENHRSLLPQGCTQVISLNSDSFEGYMNPSNNTRNTQSFAYKPVDNKTIEKIAMKLAPVYCEELSLESTLVKNYSMFEMFHIVGAEDLDFGEIWRRSNIVKSMAVPLGVRANHSLVELDIHEKAHGPHGLVAGTTGSGKSELLQTYIMSLAVHFHPYEVGIVVIDFKGGGLVNQFKNLPHLMGAITNIDGKAVNRSLRSIKAELLKRQKYFADAEVNQIDDYIKLYKMGEVTDPLPHLLLIVDEFAELKSEQPDFMKELISTARIGRSLGVHLILATQKPTGVINDQIWSNSKFKICLKVQSQEDSREVIKSPLAAEIKEPGRAYLQIGNNEVFELFQSAYSGGGIPDRDLNQKKQFSIAEVTLSGQKKTIYKQIVPKSDKLETQLAAVVKRVAKYCAKQKIQALPGICLPMLEKCVPYLTAQSADDKRGIAIGIYDDPDHQKQEAYYLNLDRSHTFILGSAQTGKTNLLQLIIRSVADLYSPREANIYIVDCGSTILKNFVELNHVGGIVLPSDDEKMKNLMKLLLEEIAKRKEKFSDMGISSYAAYRQAGYRDFPLMLLLIDNLIACRELFAEYEDSILQICREGSTLGINLIATSIQTSGIGYKYMSNFSNKICFNCNDAGEYSSVFDRCRILPDSVMGRCLVQIDKNIYECQSYQAFPGETEVDRNRFIQAYILEKNLMNENMAARQIPEIPAILTEEYVVQNYDTTEMQPYQYQIGIDYEEIELQTLDLSGMGMLSIVGQPQQGVYVFIRDLLGKMQRRIFSEETRVYLFDSVQSELQEEADYGIVETYSKDVNDFGAHVDLLMDELSRRQNRTLEEGVRSLKDEPLLFTLIYYCDLARYLAEDKQTMKNLKTLLTEGRNYKISFLYAGVENRSVAYNAPEILKLVKEQANCLIFEELKNQKIFDISHLLVRKFSKKRNGQDFYYICGDTIYKIKGFSEKE